MDIYTASAPSARPRPPYFHRWSVMRQANHMNLDDDPMGGGEAYGTKSVMGPMFVGDLW